MRRFVWLFSLASAAGFAIYLMGPFESASAAAATAPVATKQPATAYVVAAGWSGSARFWAVRN